MSSTSIATLWRSANRPRLPALSAGLRVPVLFALLALSLPLYIGILGVSPHLSHESSAFFWLLLGVTLAYAGAAVLVLRSPQAPSPLTRWLEFGMIAVGGLALRAIFLGADPALSHDVFRYVWDAHLVAHGVSPYSHTVADPSLAPLRDAVIWPRVDWRDAPTIYPPGAELFFLAVHAFAPLSLWAMKNAIFLCDLGIAGLTLVLLRQHRLDPRLMLVYWWSPIPVLEFAYSAHVDAVAALWTLAAVVVAMQRWRGSRLTAGALLGLAVTTKLYPLLFALALLRRRDWGFLLGLFGAIALCYLPFLSLGVGSGGFLGTYFSQRFVDEGPFFRLITTLIVVSGIQVILQALSLGMLCLLALWLRIRRGIGVPAAILLLSVAWIAVSPHVFPWYVAPLLPFLAVCLRDGLPIASAVARRARSSPELAYALWLFVMAMPFSYVILAPGHDANLFLLIFVLPALIAIGPTLMRQARRYLDGQSGVESEIASSMHRPSSTIVEVK
jgi:alpha-1,6-mannosyltransferase